MTGDDNDKLVNELTRLRAENARLAGLLEVHAIAWREAKPTDGCTVSPSPPLSTGEKVALFGRLFRGRTDVYPVRWESKAGKTGYSPACANEWRAGVCEKPRVKCADCGHRLLIPLIDQVLYDHLAGQQTVGVYPLLPTTVATSSRWISTKPTGRRTLGPSSSHADDWVCPLRSRSRARARVRTRGSSSLPSVRHVMRAAWAPPSSVMPAPGRGN